MNFVKAVNEHPGSHGNNKLGTPTPIAHTLNRKGETNRSSKRKTNRSSKRKTKAEPAEQTLNNFAKYELNKGISLYDSGRYEEAIECFSNSLDKNAKDVLAWYYKGLSFSHLSKYEEAIKCYDNGLEIDPHNLIALDNLKAHALFKLGQPRKDKKRLDNYSNSRSKQTLGQSDTENTNTLFQQWSPPS